MNKKRLVTGILVMILGIGAAVAIGVNATDMIIGAGIFVVKLATIAAVLVSLLGIGLTAFPIIKYKIKKSAEDKAAAKKKAQEEEMIRKKREDVKGLVNQLILDEPGFAQAGEKLLDHMDQMDEFVERNDKLFRINDMTEFESMKGIISQAKNALYHNCRGAVNLYVALEDSGEFDTEFQKVIDGNEELIKNSQDFLLELARYTNEQNEDTDAVTMVQDYANAIGQSLRHTYN
ncbi:hypothetical protein [Butyrivibrio proteoclasticus]|uniref:hypothetical protein n=1 Tax=Butyrivibrio proteoclasticus TaxID=43305 RepID=UPI00047B4584|nr:hypothetical protein [Butyrivibrio proteoclasticus]